MIKRIACATVAAIAALEFSACGPQPVSGPSHPVGATASRADTSADAGTAKPTSTSTSTSDVIATGAALNLRVDSTVTCNGRVNVLGKEEASPNQDDENPSHPLITCVAPGLGASFKVPSMENSGWECKPAGAAAVRDAGLFFICQLGNSLSTGSLLQLEAHYQGKNGFDWEDTEPISGATFAVKTDREQLLYTTDGTKLAWHNFKHGPAVLSISLSPFSARDLSNNSLYGKLINGLNWPSERTFPC